MSLLHSDTQLNCHSYYEASLTRPPARAPATGQINCDVLVVGGGFAGLSGALELATKGYTVALIEARQVCWAASGRNGGQALVGFGCCMSTLAQQLGAAHAKRLWDMSLEAIDLLKQRIATCRIACDWQAGHINCADNQRKARELAADCLQLHQTYGFAQTLVEGKQVRKMIDSQRYLAAAFENVSGHLHPLAYGLGLAAAAEAAGVRIFEHTTLQSLDEGHRLTAHTGQARLSCDSMLLAGNYLLPQFCPSLARPIATRIMPVGTYVAATKPLDRALARRLIPSNAGVCDNSFVLDYFRFSRDWRLLFGGRVSYTTRTPRNLPGVMQQRIRRVFGQVPELRNAQIDYVWGGFVDISANRAPDFGRLSPRVYYLQGFSGHGVALTGLAGKLAAEAIAGQAERFDLFAKINHRSFPGSGSLRAPLLSLAMTWYKLRDFW